MRRTVIPVLSKDGKWVSFQIERRPLIQDRECAFIPLQAAPINQEESEQMGGATILDRIEPTDVAAIRDVASVLKQMPSLALDPGGIAKTYENMADCIERLQGEIEALRARSN